MRATPLTTLLLVVSSFVGAVLPTLSRAQVARDFSDSFPRLTISRRETFTDVQGLVLYLPGSAAAPVAVTVPTVVFSHSRSAGNLVTRLLSEMQLDAETLALLRATPLPPGGYNVPILTTTRPIEFVDVEVIAADPAGLTFRHRDGLARVSFWELPGELQRRYSFRNEPDQSVKIARVATSLPENEIFLDVRVIGSDDPANPTTVMFTHRGSPDHTIARRLADLQLTPANRAILLANLNPQPPPTPAAPKPVTFFQTLNVSQSEFLDVEIVRADPGGLIFRHRDGGAKTVRRDFEELSLPDDVVQRFGYKRELGIAFKSPRLTSSRRETFTNVTITGIDVAVPVAANRPVTFRHAESGGETITRPLGELDSATQSAIANYLAAFPLPAAPTTLPGTGVLIPPGFPGGPPVFVEIFLPQVSTARSEVFEDIEVLRSDVNGVTFRHRLSGGVAITRRLEDLPDEFRARFSFKQEGEQGERLPTIRVPQLRTNSGEEFLDVVIVSSDPLGLTFRHRGGSKKLAFTELPDDIRKKYNYNLEDALDFTRAHSFVPRPVPSRPRFLLVTTGHVPAIGAGRFTPAQGARGSVPAIGAGRIGSVPALGFAGRVPAIPGGLAAPGIGATGGVPPIGAMGAPPAIGVGK